MTLRDRLSRVLPESFLAYLAARTGAHRAYVGPLGEYDVSGASQFNLLTLLGLREDHALLDIGCGTLRAGRLFIAYLLPGRYFGIEPHRSLVEAAIRKEIGNDLMELKRPVFHYDDGFPLQVFGRTFDFLLASSIFSHAAPSQIRKCLGEARQVMTPASLFLASYFVGEESYEGDAWVYPDMVTYTPQRMRELAEEQGLVCEEIGWPHLYGVDRQRWIAFRLAT